MHHILQRHHAVRRQRKQKMTARPAGIGETKRAGTNRPGWLACYLLWLAIAFPRRRFAARWVYCQVRWGTAPTVHVDIYRAEE